MKIAVDFDGTCVDHRFPDVGPGAPDAVQVLKALVRDGHQLYLFTMRSDKGPEERYLQDAVNWFRDRDIPLAGVNTDPDQKSWTQSPKCFAHVYIDDCGIGTPMIHPAAFNRPCVDWVEVYNLIRRKEKQHLDPARELDD